MNDEMIKESDSIAILELQKKLVKAMNKPYVCDLCKQECSALYPHGKLSICVNCKNDLTFMKGR